MTDLAAPLPLLFVCEPYQTKLTRESCADRHRLVSGRGGAKSHDERASSSAKLRFGKCIGCPIGAAHARGETPDVGVVAVTPVQPTSEKPRVELKFDLRQEAQPRSVPPAPVPPARPLSASSEERVAPRPRLVPETQQEEEMPKKTQRHYKPANVEKACASCAKTFIATHGPQKYCAECRAGTGASGRKAREDATIDALLDAPVTPARKPRKLRELPAHRVKKAAATATPATTTPATSSAIETARQLLEMGGLEVTGVVPTATGGVIAFRGGGAS